MNLETIGRYLLGQREAIRTLAVEPKAIWLGLLCVLGAGFAREYDAEYLLAEPYHLLVPLGASLLSASLLFLVVFVCLCVRREGRPGFFSFYRSFLGLFWLTAPMAWLYAIPYERFLSDEGAMQANLITLGLVAAWRVILMMRVFHVLLGVRFLTAALPVLLFADVLALVAITQLDARIVALMGGVRLSPAESILRAVAMNVFILGYMSLAIWGLGSLGVLIDHLVKKGVFPSLPEPAPSGARGPWIVAGVVIGLGLLVLPLTQGPQARRYEVERAVADKGYDRAVELLCTQTQGAFPDKWDPPPREEGRGDVLFEMCERLVAREGVPEWVIASYSPELCSEGDRLSYYHGGSAEERDRVNRLLRILMSWPDRAGLADVADRLGLGLSGLEAVEEYGKSEPKYPPDLELWRKVVERLRGRG